MNGQSKIGLINKSPSDTNPCVIVRFATRRRKKKNTEPSQLSGESCESAFFPTPTADYDKDIEISGLRRILRLYLATYEGFGELRNLTEDKDYCVHMYIRMSDV